MGENPYACCQQLAENKEKLGSLLKKKWFGYCKIYIGGNQIMVSPVTLGREKFEHGQKFLYLGSKLTKDGRRKQGSSKNDYHKQREPYC